MTGIQHTIKYSALTGYIVCIIAGKDEIVVEQGFGSEKEDAAFILERRLEDRLVCDCIDLRLIGVSGNC